MRRLADDQDDLARAERGLDVLDRRKHQQPLVGVALVADTLKRGACRVEVRAQIRLDLLAPGVVVHEVGAVANRGGDVLYVAVVPTAVGAAVEIPARFLEPGDETDVGARYVPIWGAKVGGNLLGRQPLESVWADRKRREEEQLGGVSGNLITEFA